MDEALKKRREQLQKEMDEIDNTLLDQEERERDKTRTKRELKKKEALVVIEKKLKQAHALIKECEELADKTGAGFHWDISYGMGGWYNPKIDEDGNHVESGAGWQASSQSC